MHIFDQPNGNRVICAGGQDGEIFLGFYDKRKVFYFLIHKLDMRNLPIF